MPSIDSVSNTKSSINKASEEFGIHRSTLERRVEASIDQGGSREPRVSLGRHVYLSDEVIAIEKQKARANDDRLRSRYSDQWLEYFRDVQRENYVGGPGVKPLKLMIDRCARKYLN